MKMEIRRAKSKCVGDVMFRKVGADLLLESRDSESSAGSSDSYTEAPTSALAVSNKFGLTFFADSQGFGVAKTTDLVVLSKELKQSSKSSDVKDKCIIHVKLSRVSAISLSQDEITLAVCFEDGYQLFDVTHLVQKSLQNHSSFFEQQFVDGTSISTKDFCWSPSESKAYLVLSTKGKLYSGVIGSSPKNFISDVIAVCWSPDGKHIAYSTGGISLVISTSDFSSNFNLELPRELADVQDDLDLFVDTLKWVQPNSLLVCLAGADAVGEILECPLFVLTSNSGDLVQEHATRTGLVFEKLFPSVESSVPFGGSGPFMLAEYLEPWEMVVTTCRKSVDDHIVLLGWLHESESSEAFSLELVNDAWLPRIELPDDGGDNAVTGLAIDRTTVTLELLDPRDEGDKQNVPPCPVLMCTTLEGKLSFFSFCRLDKKWQDLEIVKMPSELPEPLYRSATGIKIAEKQVRQSLIEADSESDYTHETDILESRNKIVGSESGNGQADQTEKMREEQAKQGNQSKADKIVKMNQEVEFEKSDFKLGGEVKSDLFSSEKKVQSIPDKKSAPTLSSTKSTIVVAPSPKFKVASSSSLQKTSDIVKGQLSLEDNSAFQLSSAKSTPITATTLATSGESKAASVSGLQKNPTVKAQVSSEINLASPLSSTKSTPVTAVPQATSGISKTASLSFRTSPNTGNQFSSTSPTRVSMQRQLEARPSGITDLEAYFLSELETVNKMANELDALTSSIEGKDLRKKDVRPPAFKKEAFTKLEHEISALSESCKFIKDESDQQKQLLEELHDESMQVDALRTYVQSLFEQVADHKHQELWRCQKLHPEMDTLRKRLLKADQVLKQQITELESHLHNLELNEKKSYGHLRTTKRNQMTGHFQSLQWLYNTVNTQLAAAEQLAACLAQQMQELNISSPHQKQSSKTRSMVLDIVNESSNASSTLNVHVSHSDTRVSNEGQTLTSYSGQTPSNMQSTPPKYWQLDLGSTVQDSVRRRRNSMDSSWIHAGAIKTTVERSARVRPPEKVVHHATPVSKSQLKVQLWNTADSPEKHGLSPAAYKPQAVAPVSSSSHGMSPSDVSWTIDRAVSHSASKTETFLTASVSPNFSMKITPVSTTSAKPVPAIGTPTAPPPTIRLSTPPSLSMKVDAIKSLAPHSEVTKPVSSYETHYRPAGNVVSQPKNADTSVASKTAPFAGFNQFSISSAAAFSLDSSIKAQPSSSNMESSHISSSSVPPVSLLAQAFKKDTMKFEDAGSSSAAKLGTSIPSLTSPVSSSGVQPPAVPVVLPASATPAFVETTKFPTVSKPPDAQDKPRDTAIAAANLEFVASAALKTVSNMPPVSSASLGFGQFSMSGLNSSFTSTSASVSTVSLPSYQPTASTSASTILSSAASSFTQAQESLPSAQKQVPFLGTSFSSPIPAESSPAEIHEEDMEEATNSGFSGFGSFVGLGLGTPTQANPQKPNPFGSSQSSQSGASFTMTAPTGQLFRPAAFALPPASGSSPQLGSGFATGFSQGLFSTNPAQAGFGSPTHPSASAFGQPSQLGPGQQALGSALGAFGQTRQMGMGLMGSVGGGAGSIGGGGFAAVTSGGGLSNGAAGRGFAGVNSGGGFKAFSGSKPGTVFGSVGSSPGFASQHASTTQDSMFTQIRK